MATEVASPETRVWEFRLEGEDGGAVHSIPLAAYLPCDFYDAHIGDDGVRFAMALVREFCPELGGVTLAQAAKIVEGWGAACREDGADWGK